MPNSKVSREDPVLDSAAPNDTKRNSRSVSPSSIEDVAEGSDQMLPRKREREVSLEPATPRTTAASASSHAPDSKESRMSPAKKGRVQLDTTEEEDDSQIRSSTPSLARSQSPPLSVSPPHEAKVRQISQGVEDLSWRQTMNAAATPRDNEVDDSNDNDKNADGESDPYRQSLDGEVKEEDEMGDKDEAVAEGGAEDDGGGAKMHRRSDSENGDDKSLKRKLSDRGASQVPEVPSSETEAVKRPRDGSDTDDNPREAKRPSPPPPEDEKKPVSTPKPTGFMAYASTASPFAAVKGQNVFSSKNASTSTYFSPSPSPFLANAIPSSPFTAHKNEITSPKTPFTTATKRSGFEAFAGSASPFAAVARAKSPIGGRALGRSKSPPRRAVQTSAFSSYATSRAHAFAPVPKRARAESPSEGSSQSSLERQPTLQFVSDFSSKSRYSDDNDHDHDNDNDNGSGDEDGDGSGSGEGQTFGERLRAERDGEEGEEDERVVLTEQNVLTGEEEEETVHQVRGKLYSLCTQNQWRERGTGTLKLNVRRTDGGGARLVMRKEAVYTVILNVTLFSGMKCFLAQDPRYLRFSVIEDGVATHYNIRVSNAKIAQELLEEINAYVPFA